jgi:hypothetical protein
MPRENRFWSMAFIFLRKEPASPARPLACCASAPRGSRSRAIRCRTQLLFAILSFLIRAAPVGAFGGGRLTVGTYHIASLGPRHAGGDVHAACIESLTSRGVRYGSST